MPHSLSPYQVLLVLVIHLHSKLEKLPLTLLMFDVHGNSLPLIPHIAYLVAAFFLLAVQVHQVVFVLLLQLYQIFFLMLFRILFILILVPLLGLKIS